MNWTTVGIAGTLVIGSLFAMFGGSVASGFNAAAWAFTIYMVAKLALWIPRRIPEQVLFKPPAIRGEIPEVIERERLPVLEETSDTDLAAVSVHSLVSAIIQKIAHAADEASITSFLTVRVAVMRRRIAERYSGIAGEINTLAFEGAIGTILGMMTFLAQSVVLFKLPAIGGDNFDAIKFAQVIVGNLDKINLYTVMTAFITSLVGWGAKGWLGKFVDDRRGREMETLTQVEIWIIDEIVARLHLPSQVSTFLTLQATNELAKPLMDALAAMREEAEGLKEAVSGHVELARTIADDLAPMISGLTLALGAVEGTRIEMRVVDGGYQLVFRPSTPKKTG